ncbi:MAG: ribonuclease III [Scytolyngbya sp. HA4215-MV1]|jgi:ribonuclease-3|nr:ribonuclease III [Scytolyngbya sp. HA4215-MV1]
MAELPKFRNPSLLKLALTHRSYVNEHSEVQEHNERLEFLGDAVLNFLSGEFLYKRYSEKPEGELTPFRSSLVDEVQLAKFAIALDLGRQLRLGRGAELEGGRQNSNLLSSAFEAVVGAYFLDMGSDIPPVQAWVLPMFSEVVDQLVITVPSINYKSRFQEWALAQGRQNPKYTIVNQSGPDHAREFIAFVEVAGQPYGTGKGRRKQDAEKDAARDALKQLGLI